MGSCLRQGGKATSRVESSSVVTSCYWHHSVLSRYLISGSPPSFLDIWIEANGGAAATSHSHGVVEHPSLLSIRPSDQVLELNVSAVRRWHLNRSRARQRKALPGKNRKKQ